MLLRVRHTSGTCSKLCSSPLDFLGATIGTDREVGPAFWVGRPDVIAEQRRRRVRNYARTSSIDKAVDSKCGNRCARLERCWLSSGADDRYSERLYVSGASQRHSGILESHCATRVFPLFLDRHTAQLVEEVGNHREVIRSRPDRRLPERPERDPRPVGMQIEVPHGPTPNHQ